MQRTGRVDCEQEIEPQGGNALILGVDVGRFGDDPSVIYPRRGRDGKSFPISIYHQLDTMQVAAKVAEAYNKLRADICMVDGVIDVQFGAKPDGSNEIERGIKYGNKRTEIWGALRDWLGEGSIPSLTVPSPSGTTLTLVDELTGPTYGLNNREEFMLERKADMRSRGVPSPNVADALACTFASPAYIQRTAMLEGERPIVSQPYDPFDTERIYHGWSRH